MEIKRQEVGAYQYRDDQLEAQISLCKGWWRASSKSELRAGFHRIANLIAKRSPEYIAQLEAQIFGHYL